MDFVIGAVFVWGLVMLYLLIAMMAGKFMAVADRPAPEPPELTFEQALLELDRYMPATRDEILASLPAGVREALAPPCDAFLDGQHSWTAEPGRMEIGPDGNVAGVWNCPCGASTSTAPAFRDYVEPVVDLRDPLTTPWNVEHRLTRRVNQQIIHYNGGVIAAEVRQFGQAKPVRYYEDESNPFASYSEAPRGNEVRYYESYLYPPA